MIHRPWFTSSPTMLTGRTILHAIATKCHSTLAWSGFVCTHGPTSYPSNTLSYFPRPTVSENCNSWHFYVRQIFLCTHYRCYGCDNQNSSYFVLLLTHTIPSELVPSNGPSALSMKTVSSAVWTDQCWKVTVCFLLEKKKKFTANDLRTLQPMNY